MTQTPKIKKGYSVKLPDNAIHEIMNIQYVHDRYQLFGISGWKYGIDQLKLEPPKMAYWYWLRQAEQEGERADAVEAREQRLKELMKDALGCMVMFAGKDDDHVQRIVKVFRTLYPDTTATKEEDHDN